MAANWKYDERQRQIEKERIREEIIAEEITRRRILEEEVRRELMLEKKIPFRPLEPYPTSFGGCCRISPFLSPDQSRIPYKFDHFYESRTESPSASPLTGRAIGLQELPFQCHPDLVSAAGPSMVSNGIQPQPSKGMTLLARLETNVAGQKRKSPIREADQEWNNINSTKKPKGWNCMICNVGTTSEIDLNRHRQGRKHKAKEAGLIAQERSYGATAVAKECNSSNLGVKNAWKAVGESSESVHREAAEAGKRNDIQNMNIISYPRSIERARNVDLCNNGDTPIKEMSSAKSSEKTKIWCDLCQVGTTCPKDMSAHEAGKKHLAKLHKDISAKDAKGINGGDALPKETGKEITQNRLESTFIPFEMKEMLNANVVARDANTAMVSTCDPGVKMNFRADGKPSENVVGRAKDVNSNGNGDTSGPKATLLSAKSLEEIMFSSELCGVGAASSSSPTKPLPMEKVAEGIEVGNALPKETKETEKEVIQVEQESNVIPSEAEETAKNTIDGMSRGDTNSALCPLSAPSEHGLDEHKQGRKQGRKGKAKEAELAVQKTVTRKGDAPGSQKKASAKSCEKFKLWYQMSKVGTPSAKGLHDNNLYDEPCALLDVAWFIEEVAQEVKDEDVVPKGAKETGKDALQDE